ncbi:hypothetical protein [Krasilnikovia sp. MM14-A1259]|uniref:hypothetical protein n=1 Tax=Krasilnikovia sp. MM14-A1259 TaxID=3373539 RepID=UPI0038290DBF
MLLATTESLPGYELRVGLGPVSGIGSHTGLITYSGMVRYQVTADQEALRGLLQQAAERGANGVIGLQYLHTFLPAGIVTSAHGTAVRAVPVTPEAVAQYEAMTQAGQVPPLTGQSQ